MGASQLDEDAEKTIPALLQSTGQLEDKLMVTAGTQTFDLSDPALPELQNEIWAELQDHDAYALSKSSDKERSDKEIQQMLQPCQHGDRDITRAPLPTSTQGCTAMIPLAPG